MEFPGWPRIHDASRVPLLRPHPSDAEYLGVEKRHISAVTTGDLNHPSALGEVLLALLQQRPDIGSLCQALSALSASRAPGDALGAHPVLKDPSLRHAQSHEESSLLAVATPHFVPVASLARYCSSCRTILRASY